MVDDDFKVIGIISESDLLHEANIQVILVDHNEPQQAVEGIENYIIQEIIDHHKINTFATRIPINFINKVSLRIPHKRIEAMSFGIEILFSR